MVGVSLAEWDVEAALSHEVALVLSGNVHGIEQAVCGAKLICGAWEGELGGVAYDVQRI